MINSKEAKERTIVAQKIEVEIAIKDKINSGCYKCHFSSLDPTVRCWLQSRGFRTFGFPLLGWLVLWD